MNESRRKCDTKPLSSLLTYYNSEKQPKNVKIDGTFVNL